MAQGEFPPQLTAEIRDERTQQPAKVILFPRRTTGPIYTTDSADRLHEWQARIEQARSIPIESEIKRRGIKLTGRTERDGPCPKCGGRNRFSINTQKQTWNCRHCKTEQDKGDVIGLVCWLDGVEFAAAVNTLTGEKVRLARRGCYSLAT